MVLGELVKSDPRATFPIGPAMMRQGFGALIVPRKRWNRYLKTMVRKGLCNGMHVMGGPREAMKTKDSAAVWAGTIFSRLSLMF